MNEIKYLRPFKYEILNCLSICIISKIYELFMALLVVLLVYFPFIQSTQVLKLVKSKVFKISSFISLLILSMER